MGLRGAAFAHCVVGRFAELNGKENNEQKIQGARRLGNARDGRCSLSGRAPGRNESCIPRHLPSAAAGSSTTLP